MKICVWKIHLEKIFKKRARYRYLAIYPSTKGTYPGYESKNWKKKNTFDPPTSILSSWNFLQVLEFFCRTKNKFFLKCPETNSRPKKISYFFEHFLSSGKDDLPKLFYRCLNILYHQSFSLRARLCTLFFPLKFCIPSIPEGLGCVS